MEFLRDTKIDFMRGRRVWFTISTLALVASMVLLFGQQRLNVGIDFAGGTQLIVKFKDEPDVDQLRGLLAQAGLTAAGIQRYGEPADREVIIKTPLKEDPADEDAEEGSRELVVESFDRALNADRDNRPDLNHLGRDGVTGMLVDANPDGIAADEPERLREHYASAADAIVDFREREGVLTAWEQLRTGTGLSTAVLEALEQRAYLGDFIVLSAENVGPQVGAELRTKGVLAVVFSLIGMLAYIWVRFELRFGLGALVASFHDVMICLGAFALAGYEFNLTTVAAFLTVVGYSVNDTVVIFDRVRENMRQTRRESLERVLNRSLNETLSRTILTSGTTLLATLALFVLGGEVIRGFAFVLLIGVIMGTYSTMFMASPVVLWWENRFGGGRRSAT
jgi:preprotein translocase subunit SecF